MRLPQIPREQYEALQALNWSRLKLIERSPAQFQHGYGDDSSGFALGTAAHMAVLEPERFKSEYVVYSGRRAGKAWEEFESQAIRAGKSVLNTKEHDQAVSICRAVYANPTAAAYLKDGQPEFTMQWTLGAAPGPTFQCKGRGDYLSSAIVDLKSTKDASPKAFGRACLQYGYFGQAAWYSDGYTAITGERLPFVIIAVESNAPHVVQVYRVTGACLNYGREQYLGLLGKLDYCQRSNWWGGYSEQGEIDLEVPQWAAEEVSE